MTDLLPSVEALAARIADGARVAVPPDYSFCANALWRAAIRRGVRGLHLIGVPVFGYQGDLLIGAGCVAAVEIGRAHVCTPVTNAHLVCRLLLDNKNMASKFRYLLTVH